MKPAAFDYARPADLREALALLAASGRDAVPLAGGQSLVPLMNSRVAQPRLIVDINELSELGGVRREGDELVVGALTRQRELARSIDVRERCPILAAAVRYVGTPQTRNRGTIGGSLCHADPCAELPAAMLVADATITLSSLAGERRVPASQFLCAPFQTMRRDDELVTEIRLPPSDRPCAFHELAPSSRAPATVAVAMLGYPAGPVSAAICGVSSMPFVVSRVEQIASASSGRYRLAVATELFQRCARDIEGRRRTTAAHDR